MSDFFNSGWSLFIAITTVVGLLACLWLLIVASKRKVMDGDKSTGHVWDDDLKELNNPLPLWWMVLFVVTIVFGGIYLALYPGLGSVKGTLGWTSVNEYEDEQGKAAAAMAPVYARYAGLPAQELVKDARAMAIGERLFINNCATCHGSDARGSKGFPNLTDNDWLHGGTPEIIEASITNGRQGAMPPMAAAVGTSQDVSNLANYVLSLSGSPHNVLAGQLGRSKFATCAACHGADGKGNPALGAPNLADKIWLHGWGDEAIISIINNGRTNVMPAQAGRLSTEQIHVLAAYVWSLSQVALPASQ